MTRAAGVLRTGAELEAAAAQLAEWAAVLRPGAVPDSGDPREHEDRNLLLAAGLLVDAARARTGSVGAHFRADADAVASLPAVVTVPARSTPPAATHAHRHAAVRPKQRIPS